MQALKIYFSKKYYPEIVVQLNERQLQELVQIKANDLFSNTVFRLQDSLISTLLHAKDGGGSPLALKEGTDGVDPNG